MATEGDRVQDGRHLMNGTRWITSDDGCEPPVGASNVIGVRPVFIAPNAASVAAMDEWLNTLLVSSPSRERTGEQPA
jgi:hypothetical protein